MRQPYRLLLLIACGACASCGGSSEQAYPPGEFAGCITREDDYATCDEYCASALGAMCVDRLVGLDPPSDHGCRIPLAATPPSFTPTAVWVVDSECRFDRRGTFDGPDLRNQACEDMLWEGPVVLDLTATSVRCCCEAI